MAMRTQREIQRAHDILEGLILGELSGVVVTPRAMEQIKAATNILCWVLRHDHNPAFAEALAEIERQTTKAGYVLKERSLH